MFAIERLTLNNIVIAENREKNWIYGVDVLNNYDLPKPRNSIQQKWKKKKAEVLNNPKPDGEVKNVGEALVPLWSSFDSHWFKMRHNPLNAFASSIKYVRV